MTQNFLRYQGIQATKDLASSPNAKVVVIGGKDGLPVILNADSPTGAAAPDASSDKSPDKSADKSADKSGTQGSAAKPAQQTPARQDAGKVEPGKASSPRPGAAQSDNARPDARSDEPRSGAVRQDPAAQQPAPEGVSWMAPGESVTDYIKRLDKTLLQPNRGGAVRQ